MNKWYVPIYLREYHTNYLDEKRGNIMNVLALVKHYLILLSRLYNIPNVYNLENVKT